jgi:hypothetical protein
MLRRIEEILCGEPTIRRVHRERKGQLLKHRHYTH